MRRVQLGGGSAGDRRRHAHVSTRCAPRTRSPTRAWQRGVAPRSSDGIADVVAAVACERRELLLRAHRFRLRREDLEDCYSQATLELVARAQRGGAFRSRAHVANALELRFVSRVHDHRRALSGRSPAQAAFERASPLDAALGHGVDVIDERACVETLVLLRERLHELCALMGELTADQRLVLAAQLADTGCREFCARTGWSQEKYRKVGQRARLRLRQLMNESRSRPVGGRPSEKAADRTCEPDHPHS